MGRPGNKSVVWVTRNGPGGAGNTVARGLAAGKERLVTNHIWRRSTPEGVN